MLIFPVLTTKDSKSPLACMYEVALLIILCTPSLTIIATFVLVEAEMYARPLLIVDHSSLLATYLKDIFC